MNHQYIFLCNIHFHSDVSKNGYKRTHKSSQVLIAKLVEQKGNIPTISGPLFIPIQEKEKFYSLLRLASKQADLQHTCLIGTGGWNNCAAFSVFLSEVCRWFAKAAKSMLATNNEYEFYAWNTNVVLDKLPQIPFLFM